MCHAGANPRTIDKSGFDPISYAKQGQKVECVNYLQSQPVVTSDSKNTNTSLDNATSKSVEDEHGFEKLVDSSTGYVYFHNWKSGESLWEEDYILFKRSLAKGGLRPIASSFSNRPPPPSHGAKSSKSIYDVNLDEGTQKIKDNQDLDSTAQGKNETLIQRLDSLNFGGEHVKDDESKIDILADTDLKSHQNHSTSLKNVIGSMDAKIVLSETDEDESSSDSSMIEYDATLKLEDKTKNSDEIDPVGTTIDVKDKKSQERDQSDDVQVTTRHTPGKAATAEENVERKMVTQDSFNTRLTSLQSRMEEQLNDQLKRMEDKMNQHQPSDIDRRAASQLQSSVSQLGTKVLELQTNVSSKELEIVSLKRQIMSLEKDSEKARPLKETADAFFGNNDVRDENWIRSSDVDEISKENSMKESQILELKESLLNLQMKIKTDERELNSLRQNQNRGKDQVLQLESLLKQEKDAKNEVIVLLEQAQRGMKVDSEVAQSLQEDKRRSDDELRNALNQLNILSIKQSDIEAAHDKEMEENQRQILVAQEKVKSLTDDIEKERRKHQLEYDEVVDKHKMEINDVREAMKTNFCKELEVVENRLREEKILRVQNEVERNDAVQAYENAIKATKKAEEDVIRMSGMIKEAKALIGTNERLHKALHDEIDKRKSLHNHLEDLRGKIRVYVRVRPLNAKEVARQCKDALLKEDKRTCVLNRTDGNRNECKSWEFDQIFYGHTQNGNSQEDVFKDTKRLVTSAVDGFNVRVLNYFRL